VIHRLYVNNFRCLENFDLPLKGMSSALLMGGNGSGKSTVLHVLEILQRIARGENRTGRLLQPEDFSYGRFDAPMRFEIEVFLQERLYLYTLALELPEKFKELRILEEALSVDGQAVYTRKEAEVSLFRRSPNSEDTARFLVDWHLAALPLIQASPDTESVRIFRTWLAHTVLLVPIPSLMTGESGGETLEPERDGSNFAEWFTGLLSRYPSSYTSVERSLRQVMPDIKDLLNRPVSDNVKSLAVRFREQNEDRARNAELTVRFKNLSDGEKCFFICAVILAANESYGPLFCFWDEPDSHLSLSEVGHFILSLRRAFGNSGQLLTTSHHPEAIRRFSDENTLLLFRRSHLEPTSVRRLDEISFDGDLVEALIRGDIPTYGD